MQINGSISYKTQKDLRKLNLSIALPFTVSIFIAAFFSIHPPHQTLILSDSPRYLEFDSITTATYPIFLKFFASIFSGIEPVVYVQLWLYAACVGGLGAVIARLTGSPTAGAVAAAAMLLNPEVNQYLFTIMTEPLSYALTALTLAAFGAIVLSGRTVCWVAVSIAIGLAITVRTANAAFLLPLLVALLVYRRCPAQRWPVRLAAAVLPLVAVLLAEHVVWQAFHDAPRRTLAGVSAIGKAGMVGGGVPAFAADPSAPERQPLREALANDLRPMRELLAAAPNLPTWCRASYAYETFVQYRFAKDERATAESGRPGDPDSVLIALTIERLRQSPGEYVALTARHLACLWTLTIATRPQTAAYWAFIDARRPLPFEAEVPSLVDRTKGPARAPLPALTAFAFAAIGIITAIIAGLALPAVLRGKPLPPPLMAASFAALMAHANLTFTALVGIGIARYTLGMWVPIVAACGLGGWYLATRVLSWARRRRAAAA